MIIEEVGAGEGEEPGGHQCAGELSRCKLGHHGEADRRDEELTHGLEEVDGDDDP